MEFKFNLMAFFKYFIAGLVIAWGGASVIFEGLAHRGTVAISLVLCGVGIMLSMSGNRQSSGSSSEKNIPGHSLVAKNDVPFEPMLPKPILDAPPSPPTDYNQMQVEQLKKELDELKYKQAQEAISNAFNKQPVEEAKPKGRFLD